MTPSRFLRFWVLFFALTLACGPVLRAAVVSYTITGKITSVLATKAVTDEFPEGTDWTAVVSWETSTVAHSLTSTQASYRLTECTLTLAGVSGSWTSSSVADAASFSLNYQATSDLLQFTSGWGPASLTNGTIKDMQPYSFNIVLSDPTKAAISALTPAPSSLSLSPWSTDEANSHLKFYLNNEANRSIYGKITSITVTGAGGGTTPTPTPQSQAISAGGTATLTTTATGTIQWQHNGTVVAGATTGTLSIANLQPASAGIYSALITSGGTTTVQSAILGVSSTAKVSGTASELPGNVNHPNGNIYDPLSLTGTAATLTADAGQATRISFIDLNDDIVQVEFSGAGTLSLVLDAATGPAAPTKYNQPGVSYMKGHASIVITGANETTNLSVFTVGTLTAVNQGLFPAGTSYDAVADLAFVAIHSTNGKFGGLRTANAGYFAAKGFTGVYAPDVAFTGPVYVHDINASDTATPLLLIGSAADARITGGSLKQDNARAVQVSGLTELKFTDGTTSHNAVLAAQANQAKLEKDGVDVTTATVVNPATTGGGGTTTGTELTFFTSAANPPYANGAKKTFDASLTTLKFDTTTLSNPTAMSLSAPYSGAQFTDATTGLVWELILKDGSTIHEINLVKSGTFIGQWSK